MYIPNRLAETAGQKFYCSGGCNANNYIYNGDIHDAYELSCKIMRKRLECAILSQVRDMLK